MNIAQAKLASEPSIPQYSQVKQRLLNVPAHAGKQIRKFLYFHLVRIPVPLLYQLSIAQLKIAKFLLKPLGDPSRKWLLGQTHQWTNVKTEFILPSKEWNIKRTPLPASHQQQSIQPPLEFQYLPAKIQICFKVISLL